MVKRGANAFADKARRAEASGAVGVVIVNTDDNLVKAGGSGGEAVNIPVVMVGVEAGELLSQGVLVSFGVGLVCVCVYVCVCV